MSDEFDNYDALVAEAHRAVDRWETEGGAPETDQSAEQAPHAVPGKDQTSRASEPDSQP